MLPMDVSFIPQKNIPASDGSRCVPQLSHVYSYCIIKNPDSSTSSFTY